MPAAAAAEKTALPFKVEQRDPATLKPHPKNSRFHPEVQLKQLAASLRRFGITKPILIDDDDMILAGHATTLAAIECKLPSVPVVIAHDWSDEQKRAYLIADNAVQQAYERRYHRGRQDEARQSRRGPSDGGSYQERGGYYNSR